MATASNSIFSQFVVLNAAKDASVENADADLYARLANNYEGFVGCELISCHTFENDWDTWEIHPKGDEVVLLLSGKVTFVFKKDHGEESVVLSESGDYAIVPRNTWHTARVTEKTSVLFITPGEGTQNAADPA